MRTVVYHGPGHVLVAGGRSIPRGVRTPISEELFAQLQRDPSMTLEEVDQETEATGPGPEQDPADQADEHADNGEEE